MQQGEPVPDWRCAWDLIGMIVKGRLLWFFIVSFGERMSQVTVGENEGIESALRRFKRSVAKAGIFSDLRRIRHHETPVEKYKRKLKQRSRNRRR